MLNIKIICDNCESPLEVLGGLRRVEGEMELEFKVIPCEVCQQSDATMGRFLIKESVKVLWQI